MADCRVESMPSPGHRWFEFNDAEVNWVHSQAIEKMFQGKKSAYMLFYRKQSLFRPAEGLCSLHKCVKLMCVLGKGHQA